MKRPVQFILVFILGISSAFSQRIKVAAAANTQFAVRELIEAFEQLEDIEVDAIIGSSGKLVAQITKNAPYHIFISANMEYATYVHEKGKAIGEPSVYARGTGVLWTTKEVDLSRGMEALKNDDIRKIAIASPKNAPYGKLAVDALTAAGYYDGVKDKLVYGSSISQVNQYVTLGAVDVGITSKSIIMSESMRDVGSWSEITGYYVDQGMVMLAHCKQDGFEEAKKFYEFLKTDTAKDIFIKNGYVVNQSHGDD